MYTTDTLIMSCGEMSLAGLSQDTNQSLLPCEGHASQKTSMTLSEALAAMLTQALQQRRLIFGVKDCAKMMGCSPNRVMMCILPELSKDDVAINIQHMLLQSFCWENDIRLLNVKDDRKLLELLQGEGSEVNESNVSCILIECPNDGQSEADEFVCGYHDVARDIVPRPIIQLPD